MKHFTNLTVIISIFLMFFGFYFLLIESYKSLTELESENYFTASVAVPDFKAGDDPLIVYNRVVKKPFVGIYRVEVKNIDGQLICRGSNVATPYDYTPDDALNAEEETLSWFVHPLIGPDNLDKNDRCHEVIARDTSTRYYITWSFDIIEGNRSDVYIPPVSNIFEVER